MKLLTWTLLSSLLLLFGITDSATAFNPSGHFESVGFIVAESLGALQLTAPEQHVVTACAQLPDMNQQMDAVKTYFTAMHESFPDWLRWGASDRLGNSQLQQMFAVQQLVHALTGGNSAAMHAVSLTALAKLRDQVSTGPKAGPVRVENLCALGLGLHLWGDSFAHTHVTWNQDATATQTLTMYPTGRGHGLSEGHLPDDILCSYYSKDGPSGNIDCHENWDGAPHRRFLLWEAYWSKLEPLLNRPNLSIEGIDAIASSRIYTAEKVRAVETAIKSLYDEKGRGRLTPDGFDLVLRTGIQSILQPDGGLRLTDTMVPFRAEIDLLDHVGFSSEYPSCDKILGMILNLPEIKKYTQGNLDCAAVWGQYYPLAIESFRSIIDGNTTNSGDPASGLPIDPDWRAIYGSGKTPATSAPITCYAKQVALPTDSPGMNCTFVK